MHRRGLHSGFSLIELMVVLAIFLIVSGAVFELLNAAQLRYRAEQQVLDALQGARTGLDQLTRDIHRAGYPPLNGYDTPAAIVVSATGVPDPRVAVPFVGMIGNAVDQTCIIDTVTPANSTCDIPGPYDLVVEADLDPEDGNQQVEWLYYQVALPGGAGPTCTLYRMAADKALGADPTDPTTVTFKGQAAALTPLAEQIINRQDGTCGVDPADPLNQPVFQYACEDGAATCNPQNIAEVLIQLQARPLSPDFQTGEVRAVTLQSVARRMNPPE